MTKKLPILLVEDDPVDVQSVQRSLRENNVLNDLGVVGNGEEALAFLHKQTPYPDAFKPGLILLDLQMPRMNGLEFLKVVKSDDRLKRIPVVVLTTSQEESDRFESFNLGVAGYIIKPVDFHKFVNAVQIIRLYWTLSEQPPD